MRSRTITPAAGASPGVRTTTKERVSDARSSDRRRHPHAHRARRQGLAEERPRRRPRGDPAARADRAQPRARAELDRRHHDGLRLLRGRAGLQRRARRGAARGHRPPRPGDAPSTASAPPRCRPRGWPSTRSRPARATPTSPPASRPSRAPGGGAPFEFNHAVDGSEGSAYNVYIPMGHDRRERRRTLQGQPRGPGRMGRDLARRAPSRPSTAATSTGRSCRSPCPRTTTSTRRATRSTCPRRSSASDDGPRAGHHAGEARGAEAGLQGGRDRHGRQRLPAQRRRGGAADHVRGTRRRSWA